MKIITAFTVQHFPICNFGLNWSQKISTHSFHKGSGQPHATLLWVFHSGIYFGNLQTKIVAFKIYIAQVITIISCLYTKRGLQGNKDQCLCCCLKLLMSNKISHYPFFFSVQSWLGHLKDNRRDNEVRHSFQCSSLNAVLHSIFYCNYTEIILCLHKRVTLSGYLCSSPIHTIRNAKNLLPEQMFSRHRKTVFIKVLSAVLSPNFEQAAPPSHLVCIHIFCQNERKCLSIKIKLLNYFLL